MKEDKYALFRIFSPKYRKSSKKQKGVILTEVVSLTGYHRKHARKLLNNPPSRKKFKRYRPSTYLKPKTPYQRVLEHPSIDDTTKVNLRSKYLSLNSAGLIRRINRLTNKLLKG